MYFNNLGFNFKGKITQKYLRDFLRLLYKLKTWNNNNPLFSWGSSKDKNILLKKLNWKVICISCRTGGWKTLFYKLRFKVSKKKICKNLKIKSYFCLHGLDNDKIWINFQRRKFSSVFLLKKKIDKRSGKFKNILPIISSVNNIYEAWYEIKSFSDNTIFRNNKFKILKEFEFRWFQIISLKMKLVNNNDWKMSHIFIDKWNKKNKKIIITSNFQKKITKKAILRIMKYIYKGVSYWELIDLDVFKNFKTIDKLSSEIKNSRVRIQNKLKIYENRKWILKPIFKTNFCLDTGSSTKLGLRFIQRTWTSVDQFWLLDIVKIFEKISYNKLIYEVEGTIYDYKFTKKLRKLLKVEIMNFKTIPKDLLGKVFYDSIIFLLWNVYLIFFDKFIRKLKKKYDTKRFTFSYKGYGSNIKSIAFKNSVFTKSFIKMNYIRFANNTLFGFSMNKFFAKRIIKFVRTFIKFELQSDCPAFDPEKKWSSVLSKSITFLGFKIWISFSKFCNISGKYPRLYKLKRSIHHNKVMKLNKYSKMQKNILLKMHKNVINSIFLVGQVFLKEASTKSMIDHSNLKNTIFRIESEILASPLISKSLNQTNFSAQIKWTLGEQMKLNSIKILMQKWLQQAKDLIGKNNSSQDTFEYFLSSKFMKVKKVYTKELESVLSKNFDKNVLKPSVNKMESSSNKILSNSFIQILFPKNIFLKKLRSLKIVNKIMTKSTGIDFLLTLKDQDIISWFSLKAKSIWNYYNCVDNLEDVKKILNWTLRYSLLSVLSKKHKSSFRTIMSRDLPTFSRIHYYKTTVSIIKTYLIASYPSQEYYNKKRKKSNNNSLNFLELEKILRSK